MQVCAAEMGVRPGEQVMRRFWKKDILTIWLITHQVSCWLFKFGWKTWKSKTQFLESAIILVNINQQPYLFCTAPSPQKNNKTPQQLSAADADLFVSPASELPTNQTQVFLVVNQHQPNQSLKKIAISWGVGGYKNPTFPHLSTHLSTHTFFPPSLPRRKRFKSWKLFKVVVAALPKSRKPNAWRRQQQRLWPGSGWVWYSMGLGNWEGTDLGEPHVVWCFIWKFRKHP